MSSLISNGVRATSLAMSEAARYTGVYASAVLGVTVGMPAESKLGMSTP